MPRGFQSLWITSPVDCKPCKLHALATNTQDTLNRRELQAPVCVLLIVTPVDCKHCRLQALFITTHVDYGSVTEWLNTEWLNTEWLTNLDLVIQSIDVTEWLNTEWLITLKFWFSRSVQKCYRMTKDWMTKANPRLFSSSIRLPND